MQLLEGAISRLFPLLAILVLSAGCRTPSSLFTASGPGWRIQQGQAIWRPSKSAPEIAGDLLVASHDNDLYFIQFSKTPMTLVSAQTTRTNWLIQFPPRRMSFSGRNKPLDHFAWLYLPTVLAQQPLPKEMIVERKAEGAWRLENTRSGETLEGFLAP